ncbi:MAG TPA: SDR family NAD(P)-dependent oxidoreductase, partial [Burkholderiaceae bacterium]|nr:SDR family NAD(P)-dependent oxidoreductase [Burkholderiaceae bacterium]
VSALSGQLDGEKIDVAWYIAGVIDRADARTPPTQPDFDRVMHANVLGAMQVIPQVAPLVEAARGRFGFITSQMGHIGSVSSGGAWLYRVSKAALNMSVKAAQPSYPDALFALFHPGWVQTEMGGANATVTVPDSAAGLIGSLAALTAADRGVFMAYDGKRYDGW